MNRDEVLTFFRNRVRLSEYDKLDAWMKRYARWLFIPSDKINIKENAQLYGRPRTFTVYYGKHTHTVTLSIIRRVGAETVNVE
jgi:hypothetical protein